MVAGMDTAVENDHRAGGEPSLEVHLLGPMSISRNDSVLVLPASRKVRALFAFLAVSPVPVSRSHLCELLWDIPNDPRGELRWCLSKLRRILDEPGRRRIGTGDGTIRVDLADCFVDVLEIARATRQGIERLEPERLRALSALFVGEFLEGLDLGRSPDFNAWMNAQRRWFHGRHVAVLENLVKSAAGEEVFGYLESWLQLAPFDSQVHGILLAALARRGRIPDGERHVAATARLFEADGLDPRPIRNLWRTARAETTGSSPLVTSIGNSGSSAMPGAVARRASVAVMPFEDQTSLAEDGHRSGVADGLVHDVITRLAKLRSLFVIAPGSVIALREQRVGARSAGRTADVDYILSGSLQRQDKRLTLAVELAETRTARIVWAEVFHYRPDDAFLVLDEIGNRIVASIASEIETVECNRAILKAPGSLDAWEAHHRGLWHMYRFDRTENDRARQFFEMAADLDPTLAWAYAGLSFTHLQDAFRGWEQPEAAIARAMEAARQSLMADDRDPAAHWAMSHALRLRGRQDHSLVELETAIDLSPDFALGHFALAFARRENSGANASIDIAALKRHRLASWTSGDYAVIGTKLPIVGELLAEACDLRWDERVLDIAAGNGNITLAAARRGCRVTSTEYVPSPLEPGERAEAEGLQASSLLMTCEELPFEDASFEAVVSTFGVISASNHGKAASELARVCRPGGRIGLANWTPEGILGRVLNALARYLPPPAGVQSPFLWGVEAYLWSLFGKYAAGIAATRRVFNFRYRSAAHFVEVVRNWCAPVQKAFAALRDEQARALEHDLLDLLNGPDCASGDSLVVPGEYLEVVITRR